MTRGHDQGRHHFTCLIFPVAYDRYRPEADYHKGLRRHNNATFCALLAVHLPDLLTGTG